MKWVKECGTSSPELSPASLLGWCTRSRPGRTCWRPSAASAPARHEMSHSALWWTPWSRWWRRRWCRTCGRRARRTWRHLRRGRSWRISSWTPPQSGGRWDSPSGSRGTTPAARGRWTPCFLSGRSRPQAATCYSVFPWRSTKTGRQIAELLCLPSLFTSPLSLRFCSPRRRLLCFLCSYRGPTTLINILVWIS